MRAGLFFAAVCAALLMGGAEAQAAPITFTYAGNGSGMIGATTFTDADFLITALADTANIMPWAPASGGTQLTHDSLTIEIAGLGTATITTASHTWAVPSGSPGGLGKNLGENWMSWDDGAFAGFDLASNLTATSPPLHLNQFHTVATTLGTLKVESLNGEFTFTSRLGAAVPEPGSIALLGLGVFGLGVVSRRRRIRS